MVQKTRINIPTVEVADFCRRHHIRKLMLFGSILSDHFGPASDVDILVEFAPNQGPGYLRLCEIEEELSGLLDNRKVDIVTLKVLNHRIRDRVLAEAVVQYAEG